MLLAGKVALVTGGARGIGRAIASILAMEGATVAVNDLEAAAANDTAVAINSAGGKAQPFPASVSDTSSVEAMLRQVVSELGGLDILVNNAGISRDNLLPRVSEKDWDSVIDTNLKGVFNCCRYGIRPMLKQRSGRIINIASVVGGAIGNPGQTTYAASKAGIVGFSKSLAREVGSRGILVNCVAPGFVATDMTEALNEEAKREMLNRIPLGRPAQPEDIAQVVLFLASPAASYLTGQVLFVDGGMTC